MNKITERCRQEIRRSAEQIAEIQSRLDRNFQLRDISGDARRAWLEAAEELRARYNNLAFPGGADTAVQRVRQGEPYAMESAVCFLELRPYFLRSGYMFKDFLRACRKAPLTEEQRIRFDEVERRYWLWRDKKRSEARNRLNPSTAN